MLGQYEEAIAHYNIALDACQTNWEIFYNRGLTYLSLQNFEKAVEDFGKAMSPDLEKKIQYKIQFNLGVTYRRIAQVTQPPRKSDKAKAEEVAQPVEQKPTDKKDEKPPAKSEKLVQS